MNWDLAWYVAILVGLLAVVGLVAYRRMFWKCEIAIKSARRLQDENRRELKTCDLRIDSISNQCVILTERLGKCCEADRESYQKQLANMQRKLERANEDRKMAEKRVDKYVSEEMWWMSELNNRRAILGLKPKT